MIIISDNHESLATWCRAIESRKESAFLWLTSHTCKAFSLCSGWIWFVISSTCAWLLFVIFVKEKCAMNMPAKTMVHTCRQKILKPRSAQISERSMRPELISRSFLHPHILHHRQFLDPLCPPATYGEDVMTPQMKLGGGLSGCSVMLGVGGMSNWVDKNVSKCNDVCS